MIMGHSMRCVVQRRRIWLCTLVHRTPMLHIALLTANWCPPPSLAAPLDCTLSLQVISLVHSELHAIKAAVPEPLSHWRMYSCCTPPTSHNVLVKGDIRQ